VLTAQRRMCVTVGGALSETVATVSLRTKRMLMFRLRNNKRSETGPTLFQAGTVPETVRVRSLLIIMDL